MVNEEYINVLKSSNMFQKIDESEIKSMLNCLNATTRKYAKNEYIIKGGDKITSMGMVMSGMVMVEKNDYWGNCSILSEISPGHIFAESYACLQAVPFETSVRASTDTVIMFFDINRILGMCSNSCSFHTKLIKNLMITISQKNINLTQKIDYISKKTIRDRLLAYLSHQSLMNSSNEFTIPFNRQQLADYLSVDRCALSTEIGKLANEGIISSSKNKFTIRKDISF